MATIKRKVMGLVLLSMGVGMLMSMFIPAWCFIVAAALVVIGFWNLFMC